MIALILACWIWGQECPPPAPFHPALLTLHDLSYGRSITTCCLENGASRPMYYFKLEGFPAHQRIKCAEMPFFTFDEETVETDSSGKATIIAFVNQSVHVPESVVLGISIEKEEIGIRIKTIDEK